MAACSQRGETGVKRGVRGRRRCAELGGPLYMWLSVCTCATLSDICRVRSLLSFRYLLAMPHGMLNRLTLEGALPCLFATGSATPVLPLSSRAIARQCTDNSRLRRSTSLRSRSTPCSPHGSGCNVRGRESKRPHQRHSPYTATRSQRAHAARLNRASAAR
jgi:hypothetical protein